MSQAIVSSLRGPIDHAFVLMGDFIAACPDDLWVEKKGGWPIWQQLYHNITAVDFFIEVKGESPAPPLASGEVCGLEEVGTAPLTKDQIKQACGAVKARVDKYVAALNDEDLAKRNEALFARAKMDMSYAATLSLLAGHTLYHLGSCDAALRDRGLPGVF